MSNKFGTTINCMDGRVQQCVNEYVSKKAQVEYVDTITLAGPVKVVSENSDSDLVENLRFRLDISINGHGSRYIAVVGHHDCAGVPEDDSTHKQYVLNSANKVKNWYPSVIVEALWVNDKFEVENLE